MKEKTKNNAIIFILSIVLGLMIITQTKYVSKGNFNINNREKEYYQKINNTKKENELLKRKIEEKREKVSEYEDFVSRYDDRVKALREELHDYKILSGFETVEGPGVILKIDELMFDDNVNSLIFNYKYILDIISYLNAAEAEAISINGVRYTWYSEIIRGYNILVIDDTVIENPVEIKAIGNPYNLKSALEFKGGLIDVLRTVFGMDIKVTEFENITIEPSKVIKDFRNIKIKD